jgi:uncharacterized low-complexity protein
MSKTPSPLTVASAALLGLGAVSLSAPVFAASELPRGYQLAQAGEAKCGSKKGAEAKCGGDAKGAEGKCGEGKCGEGKCGGDKKGAEAKCGEGKCGG